MSQHVNQQVTRLCTRLRSFWSVQVILSIVMQCDATCYSGNCSIVPPSPPPLPLPSRPSASFKTMTVYRVQGKTWVGNISNSNVADASGEACYLEYASGGPDRAYPSPVVAQYTIEFHNVFDKYAECTPPGPLPYRHAQPRNCRPQNFGKVGEANCTAYAGQQSKGTWYSVQAPGETPPRGQTGTDGFWKVLSIDRIVDLACIRRLGCHTADNGGCSTDTFLHAMKHCPDQCNHPPKCSTCERVNDWCYEACDAKTHRLRFNPEECEACFKGGSTWQYDPGMCSAGCWVCYDGCKDMTICDLSITQCREYPNLCWYDS